MKIDKILPFSLSIYGFSGLLLLLIMSGRFNEVLGEGPNVVECLRYGTLFAVLLFVLLFVNISFSMNSRYRMGEIIFSSISFAVFSVSTGVALFIVQVDFSWATILHSIIPGGIIGWSHGFFIGLEKLKDEMSRKIRSVERKDVFSRALELEHDFLRSVLQWILWGSLVFLTAGFAAYYLATMEFLWFRLTNAMGIVVWSVLGIVFGIILPISNAMEYIRETIKQLSYEKEE